ncbi:MAG TPA: PEP-CTERM-box response regulator transcription factor [Deltaproteobacteria bacterium]|nr:PEP-CTERM-box response regulator transcription factor [Deltaproteobacteria bacterium]
MADHDLHAARSALHAPRFSLLIVEDDEDVRTQMKWALAAECDVTLAADRESALAELRENRPPVMVLDLGLPPHPASVEEGFAVLSEALAVDPFLKVVIVTGRAEKEHALKAVSGGAYDILYKPIDIIELRTVLRRAQHVSMLERENAELQQRQQDEAFEGMLGTSPKMQEVFATVRKVAGTDVPVLITGESGTGKELVAQAIHRQSQYRKGPFMVINCGAIPENLLESELFGHEKGAYTGAHVQRKGRFELADGGTLFLDEIGELSLPLQVKLLRFLQEQVIERVGGRDQIRVDVRIVAATNKDLRQAMQDGKFREDLFFRLSVVSIYLPTLREREDDIQLLAHAFLQRAVKENRKKITGFTQQAVAAIAAYPWPGNVRELENRVKRAVIMAEGRKVKPVDLELEEPAGRFEGMTLRAARETLEREMILKVLARQKDNITRAAEELGISRPTLYELMEKLGIARK